MSGISSTSLRLASGSMASVMPARFAARIFSLTPPIGSTLPRRVSSPVMATRGLGRRPVRADTIDVAMVMPAEGPSLGMAPSGTWICTARSVSASEAIPRLSAWLLTCCRAMEADSFITSPSLPVRVSFSPFDGDSDVST